MELRFNLNYEYRGAYSVHNKIRSITKIDMIREFKHGMRKVSDKSFIMDSDDLVDALNKHRGYIDSKVGFLKHIMLMDVDDEDFKESVCTQLEDEGIAYTLFESGSSDHYWIIADYIGSKRNIIRKLYEFVEVDPEFVRMSTATRLNFRAYPRNGSIPKWVKSSGKGSCKYQEYVALFKEYWESPHIEWMQNEFLLNTI